MIILLTQFIWKYLIYQVAVCGVFEGIKSEEHLTSLSKIEVFRPFLLREL